MEKDFDRLRLAGPPPSRPRTRIFRDVQRLTSFSEDIRAASMIPGSKTLRLRFVRRHYACRLLGQSRALELRRLRTADEMPICIEETYLPPECAALLEGKDLSGSLYELLERHGESIVSSEELMEARSARSWERRLLHLPAGSPIIQIARLARDRSGRPREYTRNVLRGDRYLFYFTLSRRDL